MPKIGDISGPASIGLGTILPLVTALSNPASAAIAGAVSLLALVDRIGTGRKTANTFTQKGGPQDIINKQLAAISASAATPAEKSQATDVAWRGFLKASNEFAQANPTQSKVVKQAIYKTPALTDTVKTLLGKDPLDASYTDTAAAGIDTGAKKPGQSWLPQALTTASAVAAPFISSAVANRGSGEPTSTIGANGKVVPVNPGIDIGSAAPPAAAGAGAPAAAANTSLLSRLAPNFISAGTSLLSSAIGVNAASKAAGEESDAALEAAKLTAKAGEDSIGFQREVLDQQQKNIQPWIDSGTGALRSIKDILAQPFAAPTEEEAMKDPGIQFALKRGQQALEAHQRAAGNFMSGKAAKEIDEFAQGIASTGYDNVLNRNLTVRNANLNPLLAEAGLGQTSTNQLNSDLGNGANLNTSTKLSTAANVGNLQENAAAARASGYASSGNLVGNAVANIGNQFLDRSTIQQILAALKTQPAAA